MKYISDIFLNPNSRISTFENPFGLIRLEIKIIKQLSIWSFYTELDMKSIFKCRYVWIHIWPLCICISGWIWITLVEMLLVPSWIKLILQMQRNIQFLFFSQRLRNFQASRHAQCTLEKGVFLINIWRRVQFKVQFASNLLQIGAWAFGLKGFWSLSKLTLSVDVGHSFLLWPIFGAFESFLPRTPQNQTN
jgi:hypothetical protein